MSTYIRVTYRFGPFLGPFSVLWRVVRYVWARVLILYCRDIRLVYFCEIADPYGGHTSSQHVLSYTLLQFRSLMLQYLWCCQRFRRLASTREYKPCSNRYLSIAFGLGGNTLWEVMRYGRQYFAYYNHPCFRAYML